MTGRRTVILLSLLGAGLVLLAGTRTWATVTIAGGLPGVSTLTVPGRRAAPAGIPIALAVAAGAFVLGTCGRIVRRVVSTALVLAGGTVAVTAVLTARDRAGAVADALRESLNVFGAGGADGGSLATNARVGFSVWPWVAVAGGALVLLAGALALAGGRSWSGPATRYEREAPGSGPAPVEPAAAATPAATWDALSRGEDPTSAADERT